MVGLVEGAEVIQEAVEGHGGREGGPPLLQRGRRAGHSTHCQMLGIRVTDILFSKIFKQSRRICSPGFLTSEKRPRYRDRELLPPLFLLLLEAEDEAGSAASASVVKLTCTWFICQEY